MTVYWIQYIEGIRPWLHTNPVRWCKTKCRLVDPLPEPSLELIIYENNTSDVTLDLRCLPRKRSQPASQQVDYHQTQLCKSAKRNWQNKAFVKDGTTIKDGTKFKGISFKIKDWYDHWWASVWLFYWSRLGGNAPHAPSWCHHGP